MDHFGPFWFEEVRCGPFALLTSFEANNGSRQIILSRKGLMIFSFAGRINFLSNPFGQRTVKRGGNSGEGKIEVQKRHINIWHVNNFSVTPVPDPPGLVPGRKCLFSLGSAHST